MDGTRLSEAQGSHVPWASRSHMAKAVLPEAFRRLWKHSPRPRAPAWRVHPQPREHTPLFPSGLTSVFPPPCDPLALRGPGLVGTYLTTSSVLDCHSDP